MKGSFRKPQGTVARVNIGQPIMSIRSSDKYKAAVIESLRRAKFKFPGRQKVFCWWKKLRMQITYIAFFEIDLRLQEMGIYQVWAWSLKQWKGMLSWNLKAQTSSITQIMVLLLLCINGVRFSSDNSFVA